MPLTLYGFGHTRSFRALWALCETDIEFNYVDLDFGSDKANGVRSDDYLKLNIQGKVPTLRHDDFVLTESAAIANYISHLSSDKHVPTDPQLRAKYDQLSFFVLAELEQPLWTKGKHRFALPKEQRVSEVLDTTVWEFNKALKALDTLVDSDAFAVGNSFTFADILLAHTLNWADQAKFEVPPEYLAYRDRQYQREAVRRARSFIE